MTACNKLLSGVFQHRWGLSRLSASDLLRFGGAFPHRGRVCAAGVVKPHLIPRPEFPRPEGNKYQGMSRTLRVLNVEDSEQDVALLTRFLSRSGSEIVSD